MQTFENVRWLFFDVGSTLIDETAAYDHRLMDMISGTGLIFEEVSLKRAEMNAMGLDGNSEVIRHFGLPKTPWPFEDERLYPDAAHTLKCLSERGYRLGIIANQAPGTRERLAHWGIAGYFGVICASAEMGVSKPDRKIFLRALELAGCRASEAVMIGDRLDNDILPAGALGMKTVWLRHGRADCHQAGAAVDSLNELTELFK